MKNFKTFNPDDRNLGGQRQIELQQKNHLLALINTKSQINSHNLPHPHVDANRANKKKNLFEETKYREVYETFKRVNEVKKCYIDNKPPLTIQRNQFLSNRVSSSKNIIMQDHERNIKSLINNIDKINKTHDKKVKVIKLNRLNTGSGNRSFKANSSRPQSAFQSKKLSIDQQNLYEIDQISHQPTTHTDAPTIMDYSEAMIIDRNENSQNDQLNHSENEKYYSQNTSYNQNNTSKNQLITQKNIQIPFIQESNLYDPYKELRKVLLKVIMDKGLYEKQTIINLAKLAHKNNPHLDLEFIKEICRQIVAQLYGDC